jgi:microcystin-dependent protein
MDAFIGEIRVFPYNYIPQGWLACNGQVMQIPPYQALAAVLGTTYGGDGRSTFGLPDLQGLLGVGFGPNPLPPPMVAVPQAGTVGAPTAALRANTSVVLTAANIPAHTHTFTAPCNSASANQSAPAGNYPGNSGSNNFATGGSDTMVATTTSPAGGNPSPLPIAVQMQASAALAQPTLAMQFAIAYEGQFPPRP